MKQLLGFVLVATGAVGTLWGGYHVVSGEASSRLDLANGFSVTALHVGLIGILLLTLGLIWTRD